MDCRSFPALFRRQNFDCQLDINDEIPTAGPITPIVHEPTDEDEDAPAIAAFPTFSLSEIEVPYEDLYNIFDTIPQKVMIKDQQFFWKQSYSSDLTAQEVAKYSKIKASGLPMEQLRTSRLYGVALNSKRSILGLLFHIIDSQQTLTWAVDEKTPKALRVKLANQIRNTLSTLHELGVVWGDFKAENVLIDKDENAVVIDFEGGSTRGWIDKDKTETFESDLQGLENIVDYIFNDQ